MVLDETNNTLLSEGAISDGTNDYYYPSIAANHNGQFLMAFNRSGTNSPDGDISIYAALGAYNDSGATMGAPFLLKQGTVNNFSFSFNSSPYRWGDYSTTTVDPTDESIFWTIQEIPLSSTAWGTQVIAISVAPTNPPVLSITPSGPKFLLSWPLSTGPGYVLQTASSADPSAVWSTVSSPQSVVINQYVVSLLAGAGPAFYRLVK